MSDGRPTVKTATEARQGRTTGVVRWVLGVSLTPEVVVLDCDPNRSISIWSNIGTLPRRIAVKSDVGECEIVRSGFGR
jgi:chromosome partitioning protein